MGLIIWTTSPSSDFLILRDGAGASVAVVTEGTATKLKWKRENPDGTWPTDAQAILIAALSGGGEFLLLQMKEGSLLVGDGISRFWKTMKTNPKTQSDFEEVTVINAG